MPDPSLSLVVCAYCGKRWASFVERPGYSAVECAMCGTKDITRDDAHPERSGTRVMALDPVGRYDIATGRNVHEYA